MKSTFLIAAMTVLPGMALAQSGPSLSFSAGIGGNYQPEYFGSDDYETGVTGGFKFGHLKIGRLEFGDPDPNAVDLGWRPRGSFRLIGERDSSDHAELAGLNDIDFSVEIGGGVGYTRAGNFFTNRDGDLVLGNSQGPLVQPGINIPQDAVSVSISADGTVNVTNPDTSVSNAGQLQLSTFVNMEGLKSIGGNIFVPTEASGPAIPGIPGEGSLGTILQGHLENSNVDPVSELVALIKTQRAFEMNSQTIQAADEALQVIGNLSRF